MNCCLAPRSLNLKILDLPIHYQERIYGSTKMTKVFRNGLIMLKDVLAWLLEVKTGILRALHLTDANSKFAVIRIF